MYRTHFNTNVISLLTFMYIIKYELQSYHYIAIEVALGIADCTISFEFEMPTSAGNNYTMLCNLLLLAGPTQASVSRIFDPITNILSEKAGQEVNMPHTALQLQASARDFRRIGDIPRVIGAIDGKTNRYIFFPLLV